MYILREQLSGHHAFLEARRAEAGEQVEVFELGDLADQGVQVAGKGHPASPGASDGEVFEEWEEFEDVIVVGIDTGLVGNFGSVYLPVAAEDDVTFTGLTTVEVAGEALVVVMGEFERGLLVAVGVVVPVEVRFEGADAVKDAGWQRSSGPHLAAYGIDGDVEAKHGTQRATPGSGG